MDMTLEILKSRCRILRHMHDDLEAQLEARRALIGELAASLKRHNELLEEERLVIDQLMAERYEQGCATVNRNSHKDAVELLDENAAALLAKAREVVE